MKNTLLLLAVCLILISGCIGAQAKSDTKVTTQPSQVDTEPDDKEPDDTEPDDTNPTQPTQPTQPQQGGTQVQTSNQVVINGRSLNTLEIGEFVKVYGTIQPGTYWYDPLTGLFGRHGYAAEVQIYPGHNLGTPSKDASNGDTGVLINGREGTRSEVQYLQQLVHVQLAGGEYYLDAQGNFGNEYVGYVNLRSNSGGSSSGGGSSGGYSDVYSGSGGSSSWSGWSGYGGSSGGCTYVATESGAATSGCG